MTIDERIVKLGLNNNDFEKHAEESLKTLDKLDKSLDSFGEAVGFEKLGGLIDTVTHRFSALGIAGDQVIRNLTNQVMNLVGQMGNLAKSMSIDQISAGFSKYGEKTSAVQTIMAATAKDWDDQGAQMEFVNEQLEKLNWFTDETSYSFLDMVNNIGKFTSNGFGLEESVTAMEGISTWAAISGANVAEAGRAMYNLSQAMATGSVKLMDWKSIENANMATREFKETALEIAVDLGTLKKNADGSFTVIKSQSEEANQALTTTKKKAEAVAKSFTTEQFNTQLSSGWFSKDVLMKTLQQYGRFTDVLNQASDASGMTASQVIKEIEAYKKGVSVVSSLTPYIKELASAENDLGFRAFKAAQEAKTFEDAIQATKDAVSTGWMNLWEKVFGNYLEAKKLWTDVAESFYNIFAEPVNKLNEIFDIAFGGKMPETVADGVSEIEGSVGSFSDRLKKTGRTMDDFGRAIVAVSDKATLDLIEDYGGVEEALKKGVISADLFKQALQEMAGESSADAEAVGADISKLAGSLEEYRKVALDVLRGDLGNGDERRKRLEELGYDYELIQWMAGNLQEYGYGISDEFLLSLDKTEDVQKAFEQIMLNTGYTEEEIAAMNGLLEESDQLVSDIQNGVVKIDRSTEKLDLVKGGELFRESLMNILHLFEDVSEAISEAFDLVFGGTEDSEEAIMSFGAKLNDMIKNFHEFTEAIGLSYVDENGVKHMTERFDNFKKSVVGAMSVVKMISKIIGTGLKAAFKVASVVLHAAVSVIQTVTQSIGELYDRLNRNGSFKQFADGLKNIFEGLQSVGKVVYENIVGIFKYFRNANGLKEFSFIKTLGDWVSILAVRFEAASIKFKKFMSNEETAKKINEVFAKIFHLLKSIKNVFSEITDKAAEVKTSLSDIGKGDGIFSKIVGGIKSAIGWITTAFGTLKTSVQNAFGKDGGVGLTAVLSNLLKAFLGFTAIKGLGKIFSGIGSLFGGIGSIGEFIQDPKIIFKNFFDGLSEMLGFAKKEGSFVNDLKTIAISIGILAASLILLSSVPEDKIAGAMGHLTTLLVEMIGAIKTLDFIKPGKDVSKAATALLMIAGAMLVLSFSLKILSKIDPDSMKAAWEAMSLSLLSMVAALKLISGIKINSGKLLAAGAAIMGIAAAMLVLTASLAILSLIPGEKLSKAWEAMSLSLLSMVAALYLLKGVGAGSMLAAGAAMMGIAVAMLILSVSLAILSKVIESNDDIMMAFIVTVTVMSVALALLAGIGPMVLAAGAALALAGIGFAAGAAAMLILAVGLRVLQGLPLAELAGGLALIGLALIPLGVGGAALGLGAIGLGLGAVAMVPLGVALRLMNGLDLPKIAGGLSLIGLALIPLGLGGVALGAGAIGLLIGAPGLAAFGAALIPLSEGLSSMSKVAWKDIGKAFVAIAEGIGALILLDFAAIGVGPAVLSDLGKALPILADGISSFGSISGWDLVKMFGGVANGVKQLMKVDYQDVSALSQIGPSLLMVSEGIASIPENVEAILVGIRDGILSFSSRVVTALNNSAKAMANTMHAYDSVWIVLGGNVSIGLANGIYKQAPAVIKAASQLSSAVQNTLRRSLSIHSPSRVMAEIGSYVGLGLGEGIRSESDYVKESMIVAISPALAALSALSESDFSITPTITPVVDLDGVSSAANTMSSLLNTNSNVGTFSRVTASQAERYSSYGPRASTDTNIVNELQSLSSRMDSLGEEIANMQIVLDTGVLVGATSAKMDARLGVLAARKGRGN